MTNYDKYKLRTPQDMEVRLKLIFAKSWTTWDIIMKFSAFLQLYKKWILSNSGGYDFKNVPAMLIRSFDIFGRLFIFVEPGAFIFCTKQVSGEVNNW